MEIAELEKEIERLKDAYSDIERARNRMGLAVAIATERIQELQDKKEADDREILRLRMAVSNSIDEIERLRTIASTAINEAHYANHVARSNAKEAKDAHKAAVAWKRSAKYHRSIELKYLRIMETRDCFDKDTELKNARRSAASWKKAAKKYRKESALLRIALKQRVW